MHRLVNPMEKVTSCMTDFSGATSHCHVFLKDVGEINGSWLAFDKGYIDSEHYEQWTLDQIYFCTMQKINVRYTNPDEFYLSET